VSHAKFCDRGDRQEGLGEVRGRTYAAKSTTKVAISRRRGAGTSFERGEALSSPVPAHASDLPPSTSPPQW
jgi:hypothetical protein